MVDHRKILFILAHPDDESLGAGGMIAHYAAQGVEIHLATATRGEYGWQKADEPNPGPDALGQIREGELQAAVDVLGIQGLYFLDYIDGYLDRADSQEIIPKLVDLIRRIRPQIVITFAPDGAYGHPDHVAISQFTTTAVLCATDSGYPAENNLQPHRIDKLYFLVWPSIKLAAFEAAFGSLDFPVDDVVRKSVPWEDWAITTIIDTSSYAEQAWQAITCHRSQLPLYDQLKDLSAEHKDGLWGTQELYRAMSMVNGGRQREHDIFEGC